MSGINNNIYGALLADTLPSAITTEEENERALEIVNRIMSKGEGNNLPEELKLLNLLVVLIENYEEKAYPQVGRSATPASILKSLMEENKLVQNDLVDIFSSQGTLSQVLNGKRGISKAQAKKLSTRFNLPADVFI